MFPEKLSLIDYDKSWYRELIAFVDQGYKDLGYSGLELHSIDSDLDDIENKYQAPSCFKLLVDLEKEEILGTTALSVNLDKKSAELKRVFVDKNSQGQGLGRALSLWAFDYAKNQGVNIVHIWSGTLCAKAHGFYQLLGAKDMKEERFLGGVDLVYEKYFVKNL